MMKAVKSHKHLFVNKSSHKKVMNELKLIGTTLSTAADANDAMEKFFSIHASETAFLRVFRKEWFTGNKRNWASGYSTPGAIRTNNPLENYNKRIKSTLTKHMNMSIEKFLHELKIWIRSESDLFFGSYQPNPHDMGRYPN